MLSFSIKKLKLLTLAYFALPLGLFLLTNIRWYIGLPILLLYLYSVWAYAKSLDKSTVFSIGRWQLVGSAALLFFWEFVSGTGGFGMASTDMYKAMSIYKSIIDQPMPVEYHNNGVKTFLCHYLGYYITIPYIFQHFSWETVLTLITFWNYVGLCICMLWFGLLAGNFSPWGVLFFTLASGLDILGSLKSVGLDGTWLKITEQFYQTQPFFATITDPKMPMLYQSNSYTLFWGVQHALPTWALTGLYFYESLVEKNSYRAPIYLVLLLLWSPFIAVGVLPFVLYNLFTTKFQKYLSFENFALLPLIGLLVWYTNSIPISQLEKRFLFYPPARLLGYLDQGFSYGLFLFAELFAWLIPVFIFYKFNKENILKAYLWIGIVFLSLIPLFMFGRYNDWTQRVSLPSLLLVWVLVWRTFVQYQQKLIAKILIGILFIFGSWDPLFYIALSLKATNHRIAYAAPSKDQILEIEQESARNRWDKNQFLAPANSKFFQYIAKEREH
jgi:hypothetical protein